MPDELSVRQWQEKFRAGAFNAQDRYTQCEAGWYDWFCQDHALAGRLKKIGKVVMGITDPFILDNYYVWFKNNCPLSGPLYDDVRFEPLSGERDGKYFVVSLDSPHERTKWALVTERYGFDAPEFECRDIREMVKYTVPVSCALPGALRSPSAMGTAVPKTLPHSAERRSNFIAIFHCPVKIIQRSKGRSAVAAAAYRSGEKLTNEWDGEIHDYTHKGGIVHREIMLPSHAPPEFSDRSTLWNSVEKIEKSSDAQLAREIEVAFPVELSRAEQLALVRSFIQDNFVAAGMCADFAIHDKGTGNPHAHIMLTMRPLNADGSWGAKCQKVYDLDKHGQRIPNGKGGWKNHREDTTDWNDRGNAEKWRAAWAACVNQALEAVGRPERVDHRSYKRQGIDKIPTIHMGPAASQMERRGIATEKGDINRQIAADNKLLKEIKARITRLYNWTKEQAAQPQGGGSVLAQLYQAQAEVNASKAKSRAGKVIALKANAALFNFLQQNGISSMEQLYQKVEAMNSDYYNLRGQIVSAERRISVLSERLEMRSQYQQTRPIRQGLDKVKPAKREQYQQEHKTELTMFNTAVHYLDDLKESGEEIKPKSWQAEVDCLTAQKDLDYQKMWAMRDDLKAVESLRRAAEQLASEGQNQHDKKSEER